MYFYDKIEHTPENAVYRRINFLYKYILYTEYTLPVCLRVYIIYYNTLVGPKLLYIHLGIHDIK